MTALPDKKYLRWDEVLQHLDALGMRICRSTLYSWADTEIIASKKINGKLWFSKESVESLINSENST